MRTSVQFYRDVLGMEVVYGGEDGFFSSLRTKGANDPILNLEEGRSETQWGRLIFYVPDVDQFWTYLKEREFQPENPRDASWGERFFHMYDQDGHELSFARPPMIKDHAFSSCAMMTAHFAALEIPCSSSNLSG